MKISPVIKINNRKILSGIAGFVGESERITDITVAIDKFDKIGIEAVNSELKSKGLSARAISALQPVSAAKWRYLCKLCQNWEFALHLRNRNERDSRAGGRFLNYLEDTLFKSNVGLDLTLARGLNYYTGAIIEVKSKDVNIGSICGGGRYDNLAGVFGMEGIRCWYLIRS